MRRRAFAIAALAATLVGTTATAGPLIFEESARADELLQRRVELHEGHVDGRVFLVTGKTTGLGLRRGAARSHPEVCSESYVKSEMDGMASPSR